MPARATMLTGLQQHNIPSLHRVGPYPGAENDPEKLEIGMEMELVIEKIADDADGNQLMTFAFKPV